MDLVVVVGYKEEISTVEKKSNELDKLFHMNESFVASKYEVVGGDCVRPWDKCNCIHLCKKCVTWHIFKL